MVMVFLGAALLLCALTAGFLLAFALVVMPGLKVLEDAAYLRAFQVIDGVIQDGQPWFLLMWVGSVVAVVLAVALGLGRLEGVDRMLLLGAGALYLGGVQVSTAVVHLPLNNRVKDLEIDELDSEALGEARMAFEGRWNRWNALRTGLATGSVGLMLVLLARL